MVDAITAVDAIPTCGKFVVSQKRITYYIKYNKILYTIVMIGAAVDVVGDEGVFEGASVVVVGLVVVMVNPVVMVFRLL